MRKCKLPLILLLLAAFCFTSVISVTPAYASPLTDVLPQLSSSTGLGGSGLMDILLGLVLSKFLGGSNDTGINGLASKVLGIGGTASTQATQGSQGSAKGDSIIATAQKYMGTPYVWGGMTPSGFDCSGFTQYVMKQNGIALPRTAEEQFASGTPVEKANLKVGDLVFFSTYKPGASHVGFYMGNGKFIHASSAAAKVAISSLDEQFYTEHYIGSRSYLR